MPKQNDRVHPIRMECDYRLALAILELDALDFTPYYPVGAYRVAECNSPQAANSNILLHGC